MTGSDAFARSASRWLRAYPPRWRAARGDEVTALLADLAPDDARRLDIRSGLGLVRGGWGTRLREHPPLVPWLAYSVLDRRLPPRYREWAQDDIDGPWVVVRRFLLATAGALVGSWVALFGGGSVSVEFFRAFLPMMLIGTALRGRGARAKLVAGHLVLRPGEVVTPGARIHSLVPRPRLAAGPALWAATAVASVALALGVLVVVVAPTRAALSRCGAACVELVSTDPTGAARAVDALVVLLAAGAGTALAAVAGTRLGRWSPTVQPHRAVVPLDPHGRARVVAATLGGVLLLAAFPGLATAVALPLATGAALLLPPILAARATVAAGRTRAVAAVEVRRALLGRRDPADQAMAGFLPATAWLPAGVIAPPDDHPQRA